jgi:putative ABC transport system permease protein
LEPEYPFTYQFVDEAFEERYASEKRLGILFKVFSGMALFIGCLGLLGLVGFVTEYRAKEISIRKVMGATMGHILQLISGQFVKLILIALLIAIPLAWYFMDQWLHRFAYHTSISGFTILGAGVLIISITFFTISFVALKAAIKNPVDQLRSE